MSIEREKSASSPFGDRKQWYNVRGMSQESKNVQVSKKNGLTPVLDRFVDGLASRCPRKRKKEKQKGESFPPW
jgi:hypothetical protein